MGVKTDSAAFSFVPYADGVCITGYAGEQDCIEIPALLDGSPVRRIGEEAFAYGSASEIILPDTITEIGKKAFAFCFSLSELSLSAQLQKLEESCFLCTQIRELCLPASLTVIEKPSSQELYLQTDPGNPCFYADGQGLYQKTEDGLQLLSLHTENETEYQVAEGTVKILSSAYLNVKQPLTLFLPFSLKDIEPAVAFVKIRFRVPCGHPVFFADKNGFWKRQETGCELIRWWGEDPANPGPAVSRIGAYAFADAVLQNVVLPASCRVDANAFHNAFVQWLDLGGLLLLPEGRVENQHVLTGLFSAAWPDLTGYDELLLSGYLSYHRVKMAMVRLAHPGLTEEKKYMLRKRLLENGGRVADFMIKERDMLTFSEWLSLPGQDRLSLAGAMESLNAYRGPYQAEARQMLAELIRKRSTLEEQDEFAL